VVQNGDFLFKLFSKMALYKWLKIANLQTGPKWLLLKNGENG